MTLSSSGAITGSRGKKVSVTTCPNYGDFPFSKLVTSMHSATFFFTVFIFSPCVFLLWCVFILMMFCFIYLIMFYFKLYFFQCYLLELAEYYCRCYFNFYKFAFGFSHTPPMDALLFPDFKNLRKEAHPSAEGCFHVFNLIFT